MDSPSLDYLICKACGTQYDVTKDSGKDECRICDDPRQFVPPTGQEFTTLRELQAGSYKNVVERDDTNDRIYHIQTEPKFGIGQRALLLRTDQGNILWDCIAYLDTETIKMIKNLGGIKCIIISHPHFYTTHLEWAAAFHCPVFTSIEDKEWFNRKDEAGDQQYEAGVRQYIPGALEAFPGGITAIKGGGHFDGSLLLHWEKTLFLADTIFTVPAAYNPTTRKPGVPSFSFLWSIPNMVPLPPEKIITICRAIRSFEFEHTYGLMRTMIVHGPDLKQRILDSAKIQIRAEGYVDHPFLTEA